MVLQRTSGSLSSPRRGMLQAAGTNVARAYEFPCLVMLPSRRLPPELRAEVNLPGKFPVWKRSPHQRMRRPPEGLGDCALSFVYASYYAGVPIGCKERQMVRLGIHSCNVGAVQCALARRIVQLDQIQGLRRNDKVVSRVPAKSQETEAHVSLHRWEDAASILHVSEGAKTTRIDDVSK